MDLLADFSAKTQVLLFTHHGAVLMPPSGWRGRDVPRWWN